MFLSTERKVFIPEFNRQRLVYPPRTTNRKIIITGFVINVDGKVLQEQVSPF
jgi:hypothetical protein